MTFCTVINCMDGRIQLPVLNFLRGRLGVEYVDNITEAGPIKFLAEQTDLGVIQDIFNRINISVNQHGSSAIAVVAHYDCLGNPRPEAEQRVQLAKAVVFLEEHYPQLELLALWVDSDWQVHELKTSYVREVEVSNKSSRKKGTFIM